MRLLIETLCIVAWLGSLTVIGYLVAPVLFQNLPKMTAGDIAGQLFHFVSYIGLISAVVLIFSGSLKQGFKAFLGSLKGFFISMAILTTIISEWLITPVIVALKTNGKNVLHQWLGGNFAAWHGVSQIIYLITAISLILFVIFWAREHKSS
ncbi:MAG: DUF4149 domain-containing protein [Neisseriaceae bacterium]|nr:DUF4149 domain-containing protein [Neisseriaceae bacterium]MBR1818779.1 DUF4149 domain-containing protein [Neisseriaceae bacterium]